MLRLHLAFELLWGTQHEADRTSPLRRNTKQRQNERRFAKNHHSDGRVRVLRGFAHASSPCNAQSQAAEVQPE